MATLDDLNAFIAAAMAKDDDRHISRRVETVGESFAVEAPLLAALPDEPFDCTRMLEAKVDTKAHICVLQSCYSVPVRLARRTGSGPPWRPPSGSPRPDLGGDRRRACPQRPQGQPGPAAGPLP
ncbi:MAG: hypothetical protein H0X54_06295, partial [Propionibacteriales bacterium]|nr:hypothetical protein [Propionibacteriales bacterium]